MTMEALRRISQQYFPQRTIKGDTLRIVVLQSIIFAVSLLVNVAIARILGPEGKGQIDIFRLLTSFIGEFGLFGFGTGLLYYQINRAIPLREINTASIIASLVSGLLTIVIGIIFFPVWKNIFSGLYPWAIIAAFLLSPLTYYIILWNSVSLGMNQALLFYKFNLVISCLTFVGIAGLYVANLLTTVNVILLTIFIIVANGLGAFVIIIRKDYSFVYNPELIKNSLTYGGIHYVGAIANTVNFRIDQLLLNHYLGTAAVGIYAVSVRFAELLFFLDAAINAASLYKIGTSSNEDSYKIASRIFRIQLAISGIAGALLMLLSYPLILLLYGEEYIGAVLPLIILIPGVVLWSAAKTLSMHLTYNRGKVWLPTLFSVIGALINIGLNILLIPILGIIGASVSSFVSYLSVCLITIIVFRRERRSHMHIAGVENRH